MFPDRMDSSSWALLAAIHAEISPILICVTLRPTISCAITNGYAQLVRLAGDRAVQLRGLEGEELEALLRYSLQVEKVPSQLKDLIASKSDGNPFWVKEFVRSMVDDHIISADGTLLVDSLDAVDFPSSVEGLVTSRMDRLPAALQLAMKVQA